MKRIVLGITTIILVGFFACSRDSDEVLKSDNVKKVEKQNVYIDKEFVENILYSNRQRLGEKDGGLKKWIKKHTGNQPKELQDCSGYPGWPCGPCPGFCLVARVSPGDIYGNSTITQNEYNNDDLREWSITVVYDDTTLIDTLMIIEFVEKHEDFVTSEGNFEVPSQLNLGDTLADSLGRTNLIIMSGTYEVVDDKTVIVVE